MIQKKKNRVTAAAVTEKSPYASNIVEIFFGVKKEGPLRIPNALLQSWPALYKEVVNPFASYSTGRLEKVDIRVGHVIVDYLHRGQCDIRDGGSEEEAAAAFETAVGAYKAAKNFQMPELAEMVLKKAYKLGSGLPLSTVIETALSNYEKASASDEALASDEASTRDVASTYLANRIGSMLECRDRGVQDILSTIGPGKDPVSMILREVVRHIVPPSHGDEIEAPRAPSVMSGFDTVGSSNEPTTTLSVRSFEGHCDLQRDHLEVGGGWESCPTCSDLVKRLAKSVERADSEQHC